MSGVEKAEYIVIHNASENNLKNITARFPINKFTCVTGPSGCGKSSLVFDTLYAESQRNFLESMSGNMFGQKLMDKPRVDSIDNLRPALNISQNYYNVNPRSTVGTVTDISYYLRTLFAFIISQQTARNLDMNYFSPNNPLTCCPHCNGLGEEYVVSEDAVIPDKEKPLSSGGILYYSGSKTSQEYKFLEAVCEYYGIDINKKVKDLSEEEKYQLLYRTEPRTFSLKYKTPKGRYKQVNFTERGAIVELRDKLNGINIPSVFASISKYLIKETCSICNGQKFGDNVRNMKICGFSIGAVEQFSLVELQNWCCRVREHYIHSMYIDQISQIISDVQYRIQHLIDLKLEYISVGRNIPTLSGGELQRVRLATQLECSLSGLVYILDEPCKGLHYKDIEAIICSTKALAQKGNTVIAIEHNKQFIGQADHVVEMGPEGGPSGGYILSEGEYSDIPQYTVEFKNPRKAKKYIRFNDITYRNLKKISVRIPVGGVTCISGVSGSGKSSLSDILEECCVNGRSKFCRYVSEDRIFRKVMRVNQQPIGKTARSTVVSYLGIYSAIRNAFAATDDAKARGLAVSDFSMNVPGGRCECCQGTGKKKIELSYLPDTYVICPECKGRRFRDDILEVRYKGNTIEDILNKNIQDLLPVFDGDGTIYSVLKCMDEIGMGYVALGQMSMNLSGGEAQRIKVAKYLGLKSTGKSLFILDEPTSGLNQKDILLLSDIINRLADQGETIVIIEHNVEFIAHIADYLIDLGNMAGNAGGMTVIEGNAKEVMNTKESSWRQFMEELGLTN